MKAVTIGALSRTAGGKARPYRKRIATVWTAAATRTAFNMSKASPRLAQKRKPRLTPNA